MDKNKKYNEQLRERMNTNPKNKRETDVNFRLSSNTRKRNYKSVKGMTKQSCTEKILGTVIDLYKKRIEWQFSPEKNRSIIEIDHVRPICMFDVSEDEELKETFCWKNTQPLLKKDHQQKGLGLCF